MKTSFRHLLIPILAISTVFAATRAYAKVRPETEVPQGNFELGTFNPVGVKSAGDYLSQCCCWNVSNYNCANLDPGNPDNHSWWCGGSFPSCGEGDPVGGYGNSWDCKLDKIIVVPDSMMSTTVRITAKLNYDMEENYDFLTLEYLGRTGIVSVLTYTGTATDAVVDVSFTVQPDEYTGTHNNEVHIRWHFTSDGGWSDEDCRYPGAGAAQLDLIGVHAANGGSPFLNSFEDNEGITNAWFSPDCQGEFGIQGAKWEDLNCNGIWDGGESGIPGWEIRLYSGVTLVDSRHTDASGQYVFCNVPSGSYSIAEVQSPTMIQTYPPTVRHVINVDGTHPLTDLNFGNTTCTPIMTCVDSCLAGRIDNFQTSDGDDSTTVDPALDQVISACSAGPLRLFDVVIDNRCFGYTFSDSCSPCWQNAINGCVSGAHLTIRMRAGNTSNNDAFYFMEDGVSAWGIALNTLQSLATNGADNLWNSGDENTFQLDLAALPEWCGVTSVLATLQDGDLGIFIQDDTGVDFVNLVFEVCSSAEVGSIHGTKFLDTNCNGVRDGGEPGLAGRQIRLYQGGALVQTTLTDDQGEYSFLGVSPGTYYVNEVVGPDMVQTWPHTVSYRLDVEAFDIIRGQDFGNRYCTGAVSCAASCLSGRVDDFATGDGPEPTSPSAELMQFITANGGVPLYEFDSTPGNKWFAHTFFDTCSTCWRNANCVAGAQLTIRMKAGATLENDSFYLMEDGVPVWGIGLNTLRSLATGGSDNLWNSPDVGTFYLDLAALPAWNGVTDVLATLQDSDLDVFVQDDTGVDFAELAIKTCPWVLTSVDLPPPAPQGLWATVRPNPFNPTTQIEFEIPVAASTNLSIFDMQGRRVITLLDEFLPAGRKDVAWDGRDRHGRMLAAGVYFYRLQSGAISVSGKAVLLK